MAAVALEDTDRLDLFAALMAAGDPPLSRLEDLLARRPAWHAEAACRGQGPDAWYPGTNDTATEALAVCATCRVRPECAEAGQAERFGVWGGLREGERRPRRRQAAA